MGGKYPLEVVMNWLAVVKNEVTLNVHLLLVSHIGGSCLLGWPVEE